MKTILAKNLRYLINQSGESLALITINCGLKGRSTLSQWRSGSITPKATDRLVNLSRYLGVSLEDLITKDLRESK